MQQNKTINGTFYLKLFEEHGREMRSQLACKLNIFKGDAENLSLKI